MIYNSQLLKGILEGCILKVISYKKTYGYEITEKLKDFGFKNLAGGTLYPLLIRLEKKNYIKGELIDSPLGPKRKYYTLTEKGTEVIESFKDEWYEVSKIVNTILEYDK